MSRAVVHIEGPKITSENTGEFDDAKQEEIKSDLRDQLAKIPHNCEQLTIDHETPSDEEWKLIGDHFTGVKDLELSSGWNELLNDDIPLHWPLEALTLIDPCGELVRTPWILEGRVKFLRLCFTSGLRFEGPTNEELSRMHEENIKGGEVEEQKVGGLKFIVLPALAHDWLREKHSGRADEAPKSRQDDAIANTGQDSVELDQTIANTETMLQTLEIIENDAHDVLFRLCLSCGRILDNLTNLYFRATNGCDFYYSEDILHQLLPQLQKLRTLTLVLGSEYEDPNHLTELYKNFPPNLETLRFRGMIGLARSKTWPRWIEAFGNPDFLPNLQRLGFVLDLNGQEEEEEEEEEASGGEKGVIITDDKISAPIPEATDAQNPASNEEKADIPQDSDTEHEHKTSEADLRFAKQACKQLLKAAEARNVIIESFSEPYGDGKDNGFRVDDRWDTIDCNLI